MQCVLSGQKEKIYDKDVSGTNNHVIIIYKTNHKKGKRHDYNNYKKNYPIIFKRSLIQLIRSLVIDTDLSKQISTYLIER